MLIDKIADDDVSVKTNNSLIKELGKASSNNQVFKDEKLRLRLQQF